MNKESKKTKKKLKHDWNCYRSTPPVNSYTIVPSTGTDGGETAVGTKFHGVVSLLIADCGD